MICVILETLVVKGLITAGHWVAAHASSGAVVKGATVLGHGVANSVAANGVAATASAVAGGAIVTGGVVGGISWTAELYRCLFNAVDDLSKGDFLSAAHKFSRVYKKLNVGIEYFPDVVVDKLVSLGMDMADAQQVGNAVRHLEDVIVQYA